MALEHSTSEITSDLIKTKLLQDKRWTGNGNFVNDCLFTPSKNNYRNSTHNEKNIRPGTSHENEKKANERKGDNVMFVPGLMFNLLSIH